MQLSPLLHIAPFTPSDFGGFHSAPTWMSVLYCHYSLSKHVCSCVKLSFRTLSLIFVVLSSSLIKLLALPSSPHSDIFHSLFFPLPVDINAQARKLQRNRAKGTLTLPRSSNSLFCRSLSETSLNQVKPSCCLFVFTFSVLFKPPVIIWLDVCACVCRLESVRNPNVFTPPYPGQSGAENEKEHPAAARRRREEGWGTLCISPLTCCYCRGTIDKWVHTWGAHWGAASEVLFLWGSLSFVLQDCLVYLLNREQHTVGHETPSARPNICLFSPDILPLHCRLRRVPIPRRYANHMNKGEEQSESQRFCVAVEPVLNATVLVNFSRCERSTTLRHGDLLSFGAHYIFLYKDPTGAKPLPAQTLARLRSLGQLYDTEADEGEGGAAVCKMCGSALKDKAAQVSSMPAGRRSFKPHLLKSRNVGTTAGGPPTLSGGDGGRGGGGCQKRRLQLEFDQAHEDQLLNRIVSLIEPGGLCAHHTVATLIRWLFFWGSSLLKPLSNPYLTHFSISIFIS